MQLDELLRLRRRNHDHHNLGVLPLEEEGGEDYDGLR